MKKEFYDALIQQTEEKNVLTDEPLKNHVTFRVGGAADYFVSPESAEEVQKIILLCKEAGMPYYILGNGSNLLVSDQGYRGVIIQIYKSMSEISVKGEFVTAQAGALLSAIAAKAAGESLAGFEFASGGRYPSCRRSAGRVYDLCWPRCAGAGDSSDKGRRTAHDSERGTGYGISHKQGCEKSVHCTGSGNPSCTWGARKNPGKNE